MLLFRYRSYFWSKMYYILRSIYIHKILILFNKKQRLNVQKCNIFYLENIINEIPIYNYNIVIIRIINNKKFI